MIVKQTQFDDYPILNIGDDTYVKACTRCLQTIVADRTNIKFRNLNEQPPSLMKGDLVCNCPKCGTLNIVGYWR